jgi:glucose uptake protein GlcU
MRRSVWFSVVWRVLVSLAIFNPVYSISHWAVASWDSMSGIVLIVVTLTAIVALYMLSLAREFPAVTIGAVIAIGAILAGCAMQGWLDLTSVTFWQWAAPCIAGVVFAAGPLFSLIRQRESGIVGTDETPG